jgi:hypothetical protein
MEINEKKFWGLDASKIESLEDVRLIFSAMDLFVREDIPGFEKVSHLFTEDRIPVIVDEGMIYETPQASVEIVAP